MTTLYSAMENGRKLIGIDASSAAIKAAKKKLGVDEDLMFDGYEEIRI